MPILLTYGTKAMNKRTVKMGKEALVDRGGGVGA